MKNPLTVELQAMINFLSRQNFADEKLKTSKSLLIRLKKGLELEDLKPHEARQLLLAAFKSYNESNLRRSHGHRDRRISDAFQMMQLRLEKMIKSA
jgi:hypothetical protein